MLKAEWKNLFHSKKLLIVVFGLLMIPLLYAGVFLDAMWDPYGSIEDLPVAVANEDVAADFEGEKLKLGEELVDRLKDDGSLDWHFTDRQTAMDGLESGDYYMVLVIPQDFSQHASTVLDDDPREMNLEYYTNSGQNFIAEKISASAAEDINKQIAESVTKEYADAMFEKLNDIGDGMAEGADGANEMKDGSQELGDNLNKLSDSIVTFENGLNSAEDGVEEIAINVGQAAQGASELASGVEEYTAGVRSLNGGIGDYTNGVSGLNQGVHQYLAGVGKLDDGLNDYTSGVGTLNNGLQQYKSGVDTLNQGLQQYTSGVGELENGLEQQAQGASELASQSSELVNGSEKLANGIEKLSPGVSQLNTGLNDLSAGSTKLENQVNLLAEKLERATSNSDELIEGLNEITSGLKELKSQVDDTAGSQNGGNLEEQINKLKAKHDAEIIATIKESNNIKDENKQALIGEIQDTQSEQSMQPIVDGVNKQFSDMSEKMAELSQAIDRMIVGMEGNETEPSAVEGVKQLTTGYHELEEAVVGDADSDTLQGGVIRLNEGLDRIATKTEKLVEGTSDLQTGAEQLNSGVESYTAGVSQLREGADSLESGASDLSSRSDDLEAGAQQLDDNGEELASGAEELDRQSDNLTEGSEQLVEQGGELSNGSEQLDAKGSELQAGSQTLASNGQELRNGANSLANGLPQLRTGLQSLNGGLTDLASGSQELESGANQLEDGSSELAGGADELADKLREGADEIEDTNTGDGNAEMFSSPTKLLNDEVASVPNYGYGLAPYMMSVALFVGAVIFCLLFPIFKPHTVPTSGFAWWISKYSIVLLVSVLQAGIMTAIMVWGIGLEPRSVAELFLISIVVSFAFMGLISFFSLAFGNVGRFFMLILLTLQLGGSAGTFPIQLSNGFFQAIHPYLPMTYSIDAYRHAISLGGSITGDIIVLISIFIVSQLGLLVFFTLKTKSYRNDAESEAVTQ
ncbi:YhgE/Pip domain-containing protein [Sediminibacillus dalangtanensis]|nr:YhgE/Pip domain-containing protein [Sediminibacillus dalangtanensis]